MTHQEIQEKYTGIEGARLLGGGWDRLLLAIYNYVSIYQGRYLKLRPEFYRFQKSAVLITQEVDKPLFVLQIWQIKQKFGSLRFYFGMKKQEFDWLRFDEEDYNEQFAKWSYEIRGFVSAMEIISSTICERSGDLGKTRDINGWLYTLSDAEYGKALQNN